MSQEERSLVMALLVVPGRQRMSSFGFTNGHLQPLLAGWIFVHHRG